MGQEQGKGWQCSECGYGGCLWEAWEADLALHLPCATLSCRTGSGATNVGAPDKHHVSSGCDTLFASHHFFTIPSHLRTVTSPLQDPAAEEGAGPRSGHPRAHTEA